MRRGPGRGSSTKASSVQIGFILNTGIMTTFIAVMLVVLSGGFGDDVATQEELDAVNDEMFSNIIQADALAQTEGEFTAFFEPPSSGAEYTARINNSGGMVITAPDGSIVETDLNGSTETNVSVVDGSEIEFTQNDENVVVEGNSTGILLDVQEGAVQNRSVDG
ncbi:hypothetical protein EGH25_09170 [Haladaptatus sp. F3-133]|uniref:Uncharacterized protein n=1 Tax=Halorutilus salinus TaxID=2487751 RepID=A0A9Q4GJ39_9EURY|nr:hypothetical protein [Halorutilus salinus]MCX2819518.1 hypothetical protein [Halorutilus salinus]